jgi:hypothetical protein
MTDTPMEKHYSRPDPAALDKLVLGDAAEPALARGAAAAVGTALLGLGAAWGLPLTGMQRDAVLYALAVIAPLVAAWGIRRNVNSPATTRAAVQKLTR